MTNYNIGDNSCVNGYTCAVNSKAATTTECTQNNYCIGSNVTACPKGKYGSTQGLASASECTDCPPGYMCPTFNINMVDCPEKFYCPGGVSMKTDGTCPAGEVCATICPAGAYCIVRSITFTLCPPG